VGFLGNNREMDGSCLEFVSAASRVVRQSTWSVSAV